MTDEIP
ncbi:exonuclease family protein, partial [Escherichia coli 95.1288]